MKVLYGIYQWLILAPIFGLATILTSVVTVAGCACSCGRRASDFWSYWPAHYWSRFCCVLAWVTVTVKGRENIRKDRSYVFTANHQGAFDIWTVYGYLNHNFKWLMKKELESMPFAGWACRKAGHVFVDDSSMSGIRTTIQEAGKNLKDGMSLVIFPEGSRSWDGKMIPFKRGAFMLAAEFRLPVVPITIDGSFKAMPRFSYNIRPTHITITIHKPIEPGEGGFNTKQLMKQCRDAIESALPEEDKGISSEERKPKE